MTASAVSRALPVMKRIAPKIPALILNGLAMERALLCMFRRDVRLLENGEDMRSQAHDIADHFMHIAKFLRQWKRENMNAADLPRPYVDSFTYNFGSTVAQVLNTL